jgi:hypothetical protein
MQLRGAYYHAYEGPSWIWHILKQVKEDQQKKKDEGKVL